MSEMARVHLLISGRVQGVWYRASTRDIARNLNLTGWVRNLPDGRVEALAEGPAADVDALVVWCRQGPPHAQVDAVAVEPGQPDGDLPTFEVR